RPGCGSSAAPRDRSDPDTAALPARNAQRSGAAPLPPCGRVSSALLPAAQRTRRRTEHGKAHTGIGSNSGSGGLVDRDRIRSTVLNEAVGRRQRAGQDRFGRTGEQLERIALEPGSPLLAGLGDRAPSLLVRSRAGPPRALITSTGDCLGSTEPGVAWVERKDLKPRARALTNRPLAADALHWSPPLVPRLRKRTHRSTSLVRHP